MQFRSQLLCSIIIALLLVYGCFMAHLGIDGTTQITVTGLVSILIGAIIGIKIEQFNKK